MADFHQTGCVTTLHQLTPDGNDRLQAELRRYCQDRPVGLVLPALYSEFETPAMRRIVDELAEIDYIDEIVLALGRANRAEFDKARAFFSEVQTRVSFLWIDSPRIQSLFRMLSEAGLQAGADGKGRSCWLSYGYLLARNRIDVIALHDCDIRNYSRHFLARLCYPLVNPHLNFDFCKAYYARISDRMHGRVTRLFITPLIRSIAGIIPDAPLLDFLDSFRYPLAGEFAMRAGLARVNRIPSDWGLEIGVLSEVFRNCAGGRVCQVDLTDNYDHKHQNLSADNPSMGLHRMTYDIAATLFRTLAAEGVVLTNEQIRTLVVRYIRMAEDTMARYHADAVMNGLQFDREAEERAIETFALSVRRAGQDFVESPLGLPSMPNWNRVAAALPDFPKLLLRAVEADAADVRAQAA